MNKHNEDEAWMERIRRACENDEVRRELLWLNAFEAGEESERLLLEEADVTLAMRMQQRLLGANIYALGNERERRLAISDLWHEIFETA